MFICWAVSDSEIPNLSYFPYDGSLILIIYENSIWINHFYSESKTNSQKESKQAEYFCFIIFDIRIFILLIFIIENFKCLKNNEIPNILPQIGLEQRENHLYTLYFYQ